jgi:nucleotide-binding universal stress UspA family protein
MKPIKTILLTTDFSETSLEAFDHARTLADTFGSKLVVVYVEEDKLPPLVVEYTAVGLDKILKEQTDRAAQRLAEFVNEHLGEEIDVQARVATGTPHLEIVRLAEEFGADLIVMATHGRGFISHAILGSTAERVVRHAPCPVYIVRDTDARKASD